MVEGDALAAGRGAGPGAGARAWSAHQRFGTAASSPAARAADVDLVQRPPRDATPRRARCPTVSPGHPGRRPRAARLHRSTPWPCGCPGPRPGELVDPHGGVGRPRRAGWCARCATDAFVEDPSRLVRGRPLRRAPRASRSSPAPTAARARRGAGAWTRAARAWPTSCGALLDEPATAAARSRCWRGLGRAVGRARTPRGRASPRSTRAAGPPGAPGPAARGRCAWARAVAPGGPRAAAPSPAGPRAWPREAARGAGAGRARWRAAAAPSRGRRAPAARAPPAAGRPPWPPAPRPVARVVGAVTATASPP